MCSAWIVTVALMTLPPAEAVDNDTRDAARSRDSQATIPLQEFGRSSGPSRKPDHNQQRGTVQRFEVPSGKTVAAEVAADLEPAEIRELYRNALRNSAKIAHAKPEDVVLDLVNVYTELRRAQGLAVTEVKRMRRAVKARLEKLRGQMIIENLQRQKQFDRDRRRVGRKRGGAVSNQTAHLAGASEIQCADELIDLIQTTIEPESWEVNGGNGTIRYFPLLKVLVVRQTQRVHEQIGGVLGGVRK